MKNKYTLLILSILFLSGGRLYAMTGADLRYEYVNDSTYRFYYRMYQECSAFPEANFVSMCYRNTTCGGIWYTQFLYKLPFTPDGRPNGQMVDVGCAGQPNSCTDPSSTLKMYREWWYGEEVTVNQPCDRWIFSVNRERDDPGTNLAVLPPLDYNLYVEVTIDNLNAPRQSGPYFSSPVPVYACDGAPFNYNHGVIDPDGDSLVYSVIQPRSATWDFYVICAGYPPLTMPFSGAQYNLTDNPLATNNTFSIDAATGDISFTPTGAQHAYLAYRVDKYRNGALIGSVTRDARIEIRNCTSPTPDFTFDRSSVQGGTMTGDTLIVCGNTQVDFCFNAATTTAGIAYSVKDNGRIALKGAEITYQNQGSGSVRGCVSWVPQALDTGFRYFTVHVKDTTCNTPGYTPVIQTFRVPVYVKPGTVIAVADTLACPGAEITLAASGGSGFSWSSDQPSSFSCTSCPVTTTTIHTTTRYFVSSTHNNGCRNRDTVIVAMDGSNYIKASPDTIVLCDGAEYVQLSAEAYGPKPLKDPACGAFSPACNGIRDTVWMAQNSSNSNSSNAHFTWVPYWGPFYQYFRTQKMQVIYRKEDMKSQNMQPGTLQSVALNFAAFNGVNPTFNNVKISLRCTEKFEFVALSHGEFEIGLTEVYSASSVTLQPGWNEFEFQVPYDYDTSKHLVVQFCYNGVAPYSGNSNSGMLPIYYVVTPYNSSIAAGQEAAGNVCSSPLGTVRTYTRRPDIRFSYCALPEVDFRYAWTPPTGMDDPGASATGVYPDTTTWFVVTTTGRNGCEIKDSILVYIPDNHFRLEPESVEVCEGEAAEIEVKDGYYHTWYTEDFAHPEGFSCTDCPRPQITAPVGESRYHVDVRDYFGCGDTLTASIRVLPSPAVRILNNDTLINYGDQIQLFAEGTSNYLWTPAAPLNDPQRADPVAEPLVTTLFMVAGYEPDGCPPKYDSVLVRVNLREQIQIPSAFSPNGDGLNDIFRVANLKFSKILLFQVFNRWGEEVYLAPLGMNGWDGTWNGAEQPVGTYFYHIQVAFPDNTMETFTGDVTLVR